MAWQHDKDLAASDPVSYWIERQRDSDRSASLGYNPTRRKILSDHKRTILHHVVQALEASSIFDLGCGDGSISFDCPGVTVAGLDVSPESVSRASERGIKAEVGTIADFDRDVDLALAYDVFYHVLDDDRFAEGLDAIRKHASHLLCSDGFLWPGRRREQTRYRAIEDYTGFRCIRSWQYPASLPDQRHSRIVMFRREEPDTE